MKKKCSGCKKDKTHRSFAKDVSRKDGYSYICNECRSDRHATKYKEHHNSYCRTYLRNNIERKLWKNAKVRAEKYDIPFDIELNDISIPAKCPYLDIPLLVTSGSVGDTSPTLDRIDNTKGYTKNNIIVCSFRANSIKRNATSDELFKIYSKLQKLQQQVQNL